MCMHIRIYISSHVHTCARMHVVCMARLIRRGCYASKRCTCVSSVVRLSTYPGSLSCDACMYAGVHVCGMCVLGVRMREPLRD